MSSGTKLFVGGLAWATTDQTLLDSFKDFGEIASAMVITDRSTGRSKGFGFVTFADSSNAQKAVDGMQGKDIDGRAIRVDFASNQGNDGGSGPSRRRDSDSRVRDAPYQRREYGGGRDRDGGGRREGERGRRDFGGGRDRDGGGRREGGDRGRGGSRGEGGRGGFRRNDSSDS